MIVFQHQFEANEDGPEEWGLLIFFKTIRFSRSVRPTDWLAGIYPETLEGAFPDAF